ncbi:MAG: cell division protein SepF [Candidatus Woesearchaeota archaeon]|nr:cell division protein SepF [Candidatus Woesearchaeota archaeon]
MRLKDMMKPSSPQTMNMPDEDEGYVELSTDSGEHGQSKVTVRPFVLEDFAGTKNVLDSLREGYTIALVNIKPLKDSDIVELKRAINKLKKTCDAIDGDIAGFGEDWICVTPSFARIHRETRSAPANANQQQTREEEYESY